MEGERQLFMAYMRETQSSIEALKERSLDTLKERQRIVEEGLKKRADILKDERSKFEKVGASLNLNASEVDI